MTIILREAGNLDSCAGQAASLELLLRGGRQVTQGLIDHSQAFSLYLRAMVSHLSTEAT